MQQYRAKEEGKTKCTVESMSNYVFYVLRNEFRIRSASIAGLIFIANNEFLVLGYQETIRVYKLGNELKVVDRYYFENIKGQFQFLGLTEGKNSFFVHKLETGLYQYIINDKARLTQEKVILKHDLSQRCVAVNLPKKIILLSEEPTYDFAENKLKQTQINGWQVLQTKNPSITMSQSGNLIALYTYEGGRMKLYMVINNEWRKLQLIREKSEFLDKVVFFVNDKFLLWGGDDKLFLFKMGQNKLFQYINQLPFSTFSPRFMHYQENLNLMFVVSSMQIQILKFDLNKLTFTLQQIISVSYIQDFHISNDGKFFVTFDEYHKIQIRELNQATESAE